MRYNQLKRRRHNLWKASPLCHWCLRMTVLPEDLPPAVLAKTPPDNLATVDHLNTRLTGLRFARRHWKDGCNTVLACRKCNGQRNDEELRAMPIAELRRRATHVEQLATA